MAGTAYPKNRSGPPAAVSLIAGIAVGSALLLAIAIPYRLGFFSAAGGGRSRHPVSTAPFAPPRDLSTADAHFFEAERFYPYGAESVSDRQRAAVLYRSFADSHPRDPRGPEALIRLSEVLDYLNDVEGEIRALDDFRLRYPAHGRMPYVLYGLGHLNRAIGRDDLGLVHYRELIRRFPRSSDAEQARLDLGLPISESLETEGNIAPPEIGR